MKRGCSAEMPVMHTEWGVTLIGKSPIHVIQTSLTFKVEENAKSSFSP